MGHSSIIYIGYILAISFPSPLSRFRCTPFMSTSRVSLYFILWISFRDMWSSTMATCDIPATTVDTWWGAGKRQADFEGFISAQIIRISDLLWPSVTRSQVNSLEFWFLRHVTLRHPPALSACNNRIPASPLLGNLMMSWRVSVGGVWRCRDFHVPNCIVILALTSNHYDVTLTSSLTCDVILISALNCDVILISALTCDVTLISALTCDVTPISALTYDVTPISALTRDVTLISALTRDVTVRGRRAVVISPCSVFTPRGGRIPCHATTVKGVLPSMAGCTGVGVVGVWDCVRGVRLRTAGVGWGWVFPVPVCIALW